MLTFPLSRIILEENMNSKLWKFAPSLPQIDNIKNNCYLYYDQETPTGVWQMAMRGLICKRVQSMDNGSIFDIVLKFYNWWYVRNFSRFVQVQRLYSGVRTVERIYSNLCKTVDPSHSSSLSYLFNKGKLKLSGPKCQKWTELSFVIILDRYHWDN